MKFIFKLGASMLGSVLKELRAFHQLTQKDVADQLGISRPYLSKIENNHKHPSLDLLNKYSIIFVGDRDVEMFQPVFEYF